MSDFKPRVILIKKRDIDKLRIINNAPSSIAKIEEQSLQIVALLPKKNYRLPQARLLDFDLYTDGGYSDMYHIGTWSFILKAKDVNPTINSSKHRFIFGQESGRVTDKIMIYPLTCEIEAVVQGIRYLLNHQKDEKHGIPVVINSITVKTDSLQVANSFRHIAQYKENGWSSTNTGNRLPHDIILSWLRLDSYNSMLKDTITYKWVKGHDGNLHNERCDKACTKQLRRAKYA
jgi:ribonuclease HI